jgi:hypothetical protein
MQPVIFWMFFFTIAHLGRHRERSWTERRAAPTPWELLTAAPPARPAQPLSAGTLRTWQLVLTLVLITALAWLIVH